MELQVRPISSYPVPETKQRRPSRFRVSFGAALDRLRDELRRMGARQVVIEADFSDADIRLDGWPRASASPKTPRVVLSLLHPKAGALRYPCDTFRLWQDNVYAIALTLEALRAVERYGVVRKGEQYRGWRALPPGSQPEEEELTREEAAALLASVAGIPVPAELVLQSAELRAKVVRDALKAAHPDTGGDARTFDRVQRARKLVEDA